jgi:hypothetical protein
MNRSSLGSAGQQVHFRFSGSSLVNRGLLRLVGLVVITTSIFTAAFSIHQSAASVIGVYLMLLAIGVACTRKSFAYNSIFLLVYCLSTLAAFAYFASNSLSYELPYYLGGSDDLNYEDDGRRFVELLEPQQYSMIRGHVVPDSHNSVGYVYVVGILIWVGDWFGGFHTMLPKLLNTFSLGIIAVLVYRLMLQFGKSQNVSLTCALAASLMPGMLFPASHTFRDILIALTLVLMLFLLTVRRSSIISRVMTVLAIALALAFLYELRTQTALLAGICIFVSILVIPSRGSAATIAKMVLSLVFLGLALQYVGVISEVLSPEQVIFYLELYGELRGGYESFTAKIFEIPLPLGFVPRFIYGLFSPLPGFSLTLVNVFSAISVVIVIALFPVFVNGVRRVIAIRHLWPLVFFAAIGFLPFALVTGALRNIPYYWPFFVMIAGIGFESRQGGLVAIRALYGVQFVAGILVLLAYAVLVIL